VSDDLVFVEEGVSGTHASRPAFDRMLEAARAGRFQTLFIWKLSRFARNARAALNSLHELQELGVAVYFVQDGLDTASPITRAVVLPVLAGFAELESDNIREQAMLGKWTGARAGAWVSGTGPFGYRTEGEAHARHLVPDDEPWDGAGGRSAADVVRLAFTLCVDEGLGPFQVAQRLNALDVPPPAAWPRTQRRAAHRTGWEHGTVKKLQVDETYVGRAAFGRYTRVRPDPALVEARRRRGHPRPEEKVKVLAPADRVLRIEVPCLVDASVFEAAQARLGDLDPRRRSHARRLYVLSGGRTVCGLCGRPYFGLTRKPYAYMVCSGTAARIPEAERCVGAPRLNADAYEDEVWGRVVDLLDDADGQLYALVTADLARTAEVPADTAPRVAELEARIAELGVEMGRLVDAIRRGALPDEVADAAVRDVDAQRATAAQELARLRATTGGEDAFQGFLRTVREVAGLRGELRGASAEDRDRWLGQLSVRVAVQADGALDLFLVLPLSSSDLAARADDEWSQTHGRNLSAKVPPTGFEPVLPP
jgi:site-specific DNA recombinase